MRPYQKLRGRLKEYGIEQKYLAELLGVSVSYLSARYSGREPWQQDHMYKIMELINADYSELAELFPPEGRTIYVESKKEQRPIYYKLVPVEAEG